MSATRHFKLLLGGGALVVVLLSVFMSLAVAPAASAYSADAFVMEIDTRKVSESNNTFIIPTSGGGYNYTVDCDDTGPMLPVSDQTWSYTCNYITPGTYTVVITGEFPQVKFGTWLGETWGYAENPKQLLDIKQWGTQQWRSMEWAFAYADNMTITATDEPNLSSVTDMSSMFASAPNFNADISGWDVGSVTNMSNMFYDGSWPAKEGLFNADISGWDVGSVTNMSQMFAAATSFNADISRWDTGNVANMERMFAGAINFNQDISGWDASNVTNMEQMFVGATSYNQDMSTWNTSNVTNMQYMFRDATNFNGDISGWDVSNVTNMIRMFSGARAFNQDLSSWDVSNVTNMNGMFSLASVFNQDLSAWDVSNVTNMSNMFAGAYAFNQDLSSWDVSNVTDMSGMFNYASAFNQDLSAWDVSNVTYMSYMFYAAYAFNQDLSSWDVSNVTSMYYMFNYASAFNQDLSAWDVSNVTDMSGMLNGTKMSIANYDSTLAGWSQRAVQPNVAMGAEGLMYCSSGSRSILTSVPNSWNISGDSDCESLPAPEVSSLSINSAAIGSSDSEVDLYIYGSHLQGATVKIGEIVAESISGQPDYVHVRFPVLAATEPGAFDVTVTNASGKSTTLSNSFTFRDGPLISGVYPNVVYADGGMKQVEVRGEDILEGSEVWFGDIQAEVIDISQWGVVVNVPTLSTLTDDKLVDITVTGPNGKSGTLKDGFTFRAVPMREVTGVSFSDVNEDGNKVMTVSGTGFFADEDDMATSYEQAMYGQYSLVTINGQPLKGCLDGSLYGVYGYTIPFLEENGLFGFTDTPPCYFFMGEEGEPLISATEFRVLVPGNFTTTGTVVINNSPVHNFRPSGTPVTTQQPLSPLDTTTPVATPLRTGTLQVADGECASIDAPQTQLLAPDTVTAPANTTILGGVSFQLECSEEGGTTNVNLRLGAEYKDTDILSAYKDLGSDGTLTPADVTFVNRNGATYVEFPLTDGLTNTATGLVDEDGVEDGRIVDPLYIGIQTGAADTEQNDGNGAIAPVNATPPSALVPGAPNTGFEQMIENFKQVPIGVYGAISVVIVAAVSASVITVRQKLNI